MQIFFKQNLALLAVPKTGSTAYEMALKRRADILFTGRRKHGTAVFFHRHVAPFLEAAYKLTPERAAVIRDPLDHAKSWYRYRTRPEIRGTANSTHAMSFDDFLDAAISDNPPPCAKVGSQAGFLTMKDDVVPVHHLFAYEAQALFRGFLEARFKRPLKLKEYNVSPVMQVTASREATARFREARAADFALYDRVMQAGGHLQQVLDI
ncbi:hypothetical protein U5922_002985 [Aquicoccus sp. G2-2]|uniref:hypothetical protein n=1 Tax=Aquicoccus sp. G2-2 TaxID=3092120 RepID=UPI002ADF255B|nr:hypothetical protein [Aquicoccus sp. G2-2]MEA1112485.1 hypothetical protein [Aquicoccus sp. G2-2]